MINVISKHEPDYENTGGLYTIEVTTDSQHEYKLVMEYIQEAIECRKKQLRRLTKYGK